MISILISGSRYKSAQQTNYKYGVILYSFRTRQSFLFSFSSYRDRLSPEYLLPVQSVRRVRKSNGKRYELQSVCLPSHALFNRGYRGRFVVFSACTSTRTYTNVFHLIQYGVSIKFSVVRRSLSTRVPRIEFSASVR